MNKIFLAIVVSALLIGCGADQGSDFVGTWHSVETKNRDVVTVEKTPNGFRVTSQMEGMSMFDMNIMLEAESDTLLVQQRNTKRALEIQENGTMVSYLRRAPKEMSKVD
ncbi:hypothetical protein [Halopseudomonas pelagia]|uniref:hypothetical protein n=1 Tax=Halopseudomonas pelagia TaxID=553151 RepID=UPI0030DB3F6F|tara:strand:+ start:2078 stop:2404 length:327 start_codon:yes stop_codon:yes gene_type:complete